MNKNFDRTSGYLIVVGSIASEPTEPLSRKRVNEIPDAKSLLIKFLRRQLEIESDLSLVFGILAFRSDGGDWYRNPTTMAAKFLRGTADKIRQQGDDIYDPLKRVLKATKFDVRNDNFGKYVATK